MAQIKKSALHENSSIDILFFAYATRTAVKSQGYLNFVNPQGVPLKETSGTPLSCDPFSKPVITPGAADGQYLVYFTSPGGNILRTALVDLNAAGFGDANTPQGEVKDVNILSQVILPQPGKPYGRHMSITYNSGTTKLYYYGIRCRCFHQEPAPYHHPPGWYGAGSPCFGQSASLQRCGGRC